MRLFTIAAAVVFGAIAVHADDGLLPTDYPNLCSTWCGPVVTASQHCGKKGADCICTYPHMKKQVPLCSACAKVQPEGGDGNKDGFAGDVTHLLNTCGFKETHRKFSAANAPVAPALGAGALAAVAAWVAL